MGTTIEAMRRATREEYETIAAAIREHDRRVVETRRSKVFSLYYIDQRIFDEQGKLVALHDANGQHWVTATSP